jgi:hypothetical protein
MVQNRFVLMTVVLALAVTSAAHAAGYEWVFGIDGGQEVPPVVTTGSGNGIVNYNDISNLLEWNISWGDLMGATTLMHFHGPAAPGVNAGAVVNIGSISGLVSPTIGSTTITDLQEADLIAGLWYVNIHSTLYPGGEIRGQVVPEPTGLAMLALGGVGLFGRRRHRA